MARVYYDFHIHSCLSPCADNDMTPASIAGMAKLNGLGIAALTDHNSCKNCPAFFTACDRYGVVPVAGMELTTAEDIHLVCLFETLDSAMEFDEDLTEKRILIKNRPALVGDQLIVDADDNVVGTEEHMLPNATTLSIEDAVSFAVSHGAAIYPAHIDRPANGIISVLGTYPETPCFSFAEMRDRSLIDTYAARYPALEKAGIIISSDAHYLWDISEAVNWIELPHSENGDIVRKDLFKYLKGTV